MFLRFMILSLFVIFIVSIKIKFFPIVAMFLGYQDFAQASFAMIIIVITLFGDL